MKKIKENSINNHRILYLFDIPFDKKSRFFIDVEREIIDIFEDVFGTKIQKIQMCNKYKIPKKDMDYLTIFRTKYSKKDDILWHKNNINNIKTLSYLNNLDKEISFENTKEKLIKDINKEYQYVLKPKAYMQIFDKETKQKYDIFEEYRLCILYNKPMFIVPKLRLYKDEIYFKNNERLTPRSMRKLVDKSTKLSKRQLLYFNKIAKIISKEMFKKKCLTRFYFVDFIVVDGQHLLIKNILNGNKSFFTQPTSFAIFLLNIHQFMIQKELDYSKVREYYSRINTSTTIIKHYQDNEIYKELLPKNIQIINHNIHATNREIIRDISRVYKYNQEEIKEDKYNKYGIYNSHFLKKYLNIDDINNIRGIH